MRIVLAAVWLAVLAPAPVRAALPSPPFALEVAPTRPRVGEGTEVRVVPRGGTGHYDLYVMWATGVRAAFLAPDGRWSPRPVAWASGVAARGAAVSRRWPTPGPPGQVPLALVVVDVGGDPLDRAQWRFRPTLVSVRAPGTASIPAPPPAEIGWLMLSTALTSVLVWALPPRRAG